MNSLFLETAATHLSVFSLSLSYNAAPGSSEGKMEDINNDILHFLCETKPR